MRKCVIFILGIIIFLSSYRILNSMLGTKKDVIAYKEWLKKGNRGTMLDFLKGSSTKGFEGEETGKLAKEKAELEKQLKDQESKLTLLQQQLDEALKGKGTAGATFATHAQDDPRIKELEKEIADLKAEIERIKKLKMGVGGEEEAESPETIFWKGKAVEVVDELKKRLDQLIEYAEKAEGAVRDFRKAPHEEDQSVLLQYLQNLSRAVKDSRKRILELNDLKFDTKLLDAGVRVPKEYSKFSDTLELEIDKLAKIWRPQQFFGLLPWTATERPIRDKIDEIRKLNLAWDRTQKCLKHAEKYKEIEPVSIEYKPGEPSGAKPSGGTTDSSGGDVPPPPPPPLASDEGVKPPPPPPQPPAPKPRVKEEEKPSILKDIEKGVKLKSREQRLKDALAKKGFEPKYIDEVLKDKSIATEKEAIDKAKFLKSQEKMSQKN